MQPLWELYFGFFVVVVCFFLALQSESTVSQTTQPINRIPEVNFCDILPCDKVYCCPIHQPKVKFLSYEKNNAEEKRKLKI